MGKVFDLRQTGRRMPYTVPDGFFAEMENNVWAKVGTEHIRRRGTGRLRMRQFLRYAAATAAAAAVAFWLFPVRPAADTRHDIASVEQAFDRLDEADRLCLLETYENDTFINEP